MRRCSRCNKDQIDEEFNFKKKSMGLRQRMCRSCTRKLIRNHYYKNRQYYLNKSQRRNKAIRDELRKYVLNNLNSHPCVDCGEKDPIVLEFDHQHSKLDTISNLIRYSKRKIIVEMAKCVIRCANCHRRKTAFENGWHRIKLRL